jgi:hypothetical protein
MRFLQAGASTRLEFLRGARPSLCGNRVALVLQRKDPLYRITLVDEAWHVRRPRATLDHAFDNVDDAMAFVRNDSSGTAEFVELVAGNTYMVKRLERAS